MAKPYKLTPIELALSPVEHFENNLSKFLDNENIEDDKKLLYFKMHFAEWTNISPIGRRLVLAGVGNSYLFGG